MDTSHLHALETRRSNEIARLKSDPALKRKFFRNVWIAQIEKEIADEREFLKLPPEDEATPSDEELLAALRS